MEDGTWIEDEDQTLKIKANFVISAFGSTLSDSDGKRLTVCLLKPRATQTDSRTETIDSNIFKSSQYKTMKSQLVLCNAYATTLSLTCIKKIVKFKPLVLSRA